MMPRMVGHFAIILMALTLSACAIGGPSRSKPVSHLSGDAPIGPSRNLDGPLEAFPLLNTLINF